MRGEIIIADLLATKTARKAQQTTHPPTTHRDQEREAEWREDFQHRMHLASLQRAYEEHGAASAIDEESRREVELAKVRKRWGSILEEALERRAKARKWQRRVYAPRVAAWHRRMGNRQPVDKIGVLT